MKIPGSQWIAPGFLDATSLQIEECIYCVANTNVEIKVQIQILNARVTVESLWFLQCNFTKIPN